MRHGTNLSIKKLGRIRRRRSRIHVLVVGER
jgi:hypothetical protein